MYSEGIKKLLLNIENPIIYFGIGIPLSKNNLTNSEKNQNMVDFIIFVDEQFEVNVFYQKAKIF
jgi:hypothetical protein